MRRPAASVGTRTRSATASTKSRRSRAPAISRSRVGWRRPQATSARGAPISSPATRFWPANARANCRSRSTTLCSKLIFSPPTSARCRDRFAVHGPHLQAEISGESTAAGSGAAIKFELQVGPSAVLDVLRLWPSFINAEARVWCLDHIHGGDVASGSHEGGLGRGRVRRRDPRARCPARQRARRFFAARGGGDGAFAGHPAR